MDEFYDINISKPSEVYKREQAACRSLFEHHFKPRIEEQYKAQKECVDILKQFLEEQNISMNELVDYIRSDCTEYDLEYLREVYEEVETEEIEKELLRDYYASVIDIEELRLWCQENSDT